MGSGAAGYILSEVLLTMKTPADISLTARYTAAAWDALGLPHGERFSDRRGRFLFRLSMLLGRLLPGQVGSTLVESALMPRHLFLDHWIRTHGVEQVVEVASGFSRRGVTLAGEGVRYVEVDRPAIIQQKAALCRDLPPEALPLFLGLDATQPDFVPRVLQACDPARRTVLITEGLSPYFDREGYLSLLRPLHEVATALDATLLTDVYLGPQGHRLVAAWVALGSRAIALVADRIYLYLHSEGDIHGLFAEAGWTVVSVHNPASDPAFTGGKRPPFTDLMRVVEARPLTR